MKKSRQLLSIVIVFFWASEYCHVPYFTPYLTLLGFSMTAIGFMVGVYGFTQMIVRIPLGIYTDVSDSYKGVVVMGTLFTTVVITRPDFCAEYVVCNSLPLSWQGLPLPPGLRSRFSTRLTMKRKRA